MTVGELKKALQELIEAYQQLKWPLGVDRATGILGALSELDETSTVGEDEKKLLRQMIKNNWQDVIVTLKPDQWESDAKALPLIRFQEKLETQQMIPVNDHHSLCFKEIVDRFNGSPGLFTAETLSALMQSTCRVIGYAEHEEMGCYPSARLKKRAKSTSPGAKANLDMSISSMAALFYLLYYQTSEERAALIPFLIYYRDRTTDEERRSESAMLRLLRNTPYRAVELINQMESCISYHILLKEKEFEAIRPLLPALRKGLLKALAPDLWHFRANQDRWIDDAITRKVALCNAITAQFKAMGVPYERIETFCQQIKGQEGWLLSPKDRELLDESLVLFKLQQYREQRESEGLSHTFFSSEVKYRTAKKQEQIILGVPEKLGLLEWLAAHQGRLGDLQEKTKPGEQLSV
ncbi:hypothetical protein DIZ81_02880 [Legionella taurinensis]|uniref:Uncharacterized protein n=1 Tax=Legionella taurinensis TaxID=70611 RepID=A0AB38N9G0_9GAMM|nr:hypothetical protein [Legionella taurinensis]MDX1836182.1 hypothetical protein [Legionella taurinensis]PUT42051.1 hypothetical protein DB744_02885 [Legionella taurinensis]PUT44838.1 hypothetical protein DB746_02885 [Legionella taurinensis]PUT48159.1 hypothetical protein DB743_01045 [Legionella taurinensis]PUT48973.1 hypothetical protein DB745_02885 [Legionella taurinensis]